MTTPIQTASVTLQCPSASGSGRQFTLVDLLDFNADHQPVGTPAIAVTNSQPNLIEVIQNPSGNNPLEYKIRTKAAKPGNISTAIVTFDDQRFKQDGSPVPDVVVTVTLTAHPDQSSFEIDPAHVPLTPSDEADGAP